MYSVTELSKMFNTSRPTIYRKFKNKKLEHYISDTDKGKILLEEGLNIFQLIMAESKVTSNDSEKKVERYNNDINLLIDSLREQIEELKKDKNTILEDKKELLKQIHTKDEQIKSKDVQLENKDKLIENMQILMKDNQKLLKNEQSKNMLLLDNKNRISWFPFFRNKNV